ncbi:MAG: hypothetical protein AAF298_15260 [Cyanobacteria bacterium P01_A01_bin.40]
MTAFKYKHLVFNQQSIAHWDVVKTIAFASWQKNLLKIGFLIIFVAIASHKTSFLMSFSS